MATKAQLISDIYRIVGDSSESDEYSETVVLEKLNEVVRIIGGGYVTDVRNEQQIYEAGDLPFLYARQFYTLVEPVPLTVAVATGNTTISFDTTNFSASGVVLIEGDVINYTGKSSTQITGVTNIGTSHSVGIYVYQLYNLPSDYFTIYSFRETDTRNRHTGIPFYDQRHTTQAVTRGNIITDDNGVDRIHLDGYTPTNNKLMVQYYKDTTDLSAEADVCDIPDPRARRILPTLVAGELFWDNQEIEFADAPLQAGYRRLKEMFRFYNKKTKDNIQVIRASSPMRNISYGKTYQDRNRTRI